jgi:UDP-glucose 4-epimerase
MNLRILITGGAGFIGSHVAELLLEQGHDVAVLDDLSSGTKDNLPAGVPVHVADICDRSAVQGIFQQVRPDGVCHQAAQMSVSRSVREPGFDAQTNILGLINVLEGAAAVGAKRITFASSGGVLYGDVDKPAPENAPCSPVSPYGISKWAGEKYLEFFANEHGLSAVALRYSNVYGPRQSPHGEAGVVAIFCRKMLAGEPCLIHGDGGCVRDYVYVGDVARANALALTCPLDSPFTPFNIGTAVGTDVKQLELALRQEFARATGRSAPEPVFGPPRAGDLKSNLICPDAAAAKLGWRSEVDLRKGLPKTFASFAACG